jgi:hypothetical protein
MEQGEYVTGVGALYAPNAEVDGSLDSLQWLDDLTPPEGGSPQRLGGSASSQGSGRHAEGNAAVLLLRC